MQILDKHNKYWNGSNKKLQLSQRARDQDFSKLYRGGGGQSATHSSPRRRQRLEKPSLLRWSRGDGVMERVMEVAGDGDNGDGGWWQRVGESGMVDLIDREMGSVFEFAGRSFPAVAGGGCRKRWVGEIERNHTGDFPTFVDNCHHQRVS
nr:hypothetical protein [Tanacetum cinerariifolium]